MTRSRRAAVLSAALVSSLVLSWAGCDAEQRAKGLVDGASAEAARLSSEAKAKLFGLTDTGALSDAATDWLSRQKPSADGGAFQAGLAKGIQIAPVVLEAHRVMNEAVDDQTAIEPIYQRVPEGEQPALDAEVMSMPRVEVIDGVSVGFRQLDAIETTKVTKERAVLVLWRRGDHVAGFLYRKKRTIDLEVVVRETPRLFRLMNEAARPD